MIVPVLTEYVEVLYDTETNKYGVFVGICTVTHEFVEKVDK